MTSKVTFRWEQDGAGFARAIESEVRKQDEELIRQLVEALEKDKHDTGDWPDASRNALDAMRARLEGESNE